MIKLALIKIFLGSAYLCTGGFPADKNCPNNHQCRIVGGREASVKNFPFILAIISQTPLEEGAQFRGAAVIVSRHWALTAAHCMREFSASFIKSGFVVLRGNTDFWRSDAGEPHDHHIVQHHLHPEYGWKAEYDCDLAILKVEEPFAGPNERPVKIAGRRFKYREDVPAAVAGWGTTDFSFQTPVERLRMVSIDIFSQETCRRSFEGQGLKVTSRMVCGGAENGGKDACNGDSGGPLVQHDVLIGIVSFGINCGLADYPGVYTKVGRFQNWLQRLEDDLDEDFKIHYVH